jgi:hypothetical protein
MNFAHNDLGIYCSAGNEPRLMPSSEKILQLRRHLRERLPGLRLVSEQGLTKNNEVWITGIAPIDETLNGGLPKGAITELVAGKNCGSALMIHSLLRQIQETNQFVGLIDGRDSFDATALDQKILSRLLWIRCHTATEALKATDLLLRDRNLPLVILDLKLNPAKELKKIPGTTWYRLQRLIQQTQTAFFVVSPRAMVSSAEIRFALENNFTLPDVEAEQPELVSKLAPKIVYEHGASAQKEAKASA